MKKAIIPWLAVAILTAALLSGCTATGPGTIITEEKDFTDFNYVEVEGTFSVNIIRSDSFSIKISADSNFFDYVAVSKEGNTLKIYLNPRHTFTDFTMQARILEARITMPALYGLNLSGASKANVTGFRSAHDFRFDVSGASSLNMKDIVVHDLNGEISGASKFTGSVNATDVRLEVSGASKVELDGLAEDLVLNASGASKADLADFPIEGADVELSGASEATVNVKGRLNCELSAASRLYFQGNPIMGDIKVSGASTIKHQ